MGPALIAQAVVGVAQAGLSIKSQRDMAKAQATVQQRASEQENKRLLSEMTARRLEQAQERIATAQRIQQAVKATEKAKATAVVSAGEAGVAGVSVDALENDIMREQAQFRFGVKQQLEFSDIGRHFALENAQISSTMNQIRINQPIAPVDYAGAILSGAQTALTIGSAFGGTPSATPASTASPSSVGYGTVLKAPSGGFPSNNNFNWVSKIGQ